MLHEEVGPHASRWTGASRARIASDLLKFDGTTMSLSFIPAAEVLDVSLLPAGGGWISRESVFCGPASPERLAILNDRDTSLEERLLRLMALRRTPEPRFCD